MTALLNDVIAEREKIRIEWIIKKSKRELGIGAVSADNEWDQLSSASPINKSVTGSPKHPVMSQNRKILLKAADLNHIKVMQGRNEKF